MLAPARITIELQPPPTSQGRWRSHTRIDGVATSRSAAGAPFAAHAMIEAAEPREPTVTPIAYEAATECTCLDGLDGWCDLDHANA